MFSGVDERTSAPAIPAGGHRASFGMGDGVVPPGSHRVSLVGEGGMQTITEDHPVSQPLSAMMLKADGGPPASLPQPQVLSEGRYCF